MRVSSVNSMSLIFTMTSPRAMVDRAAGDPGSKSVIRIGPFTVEDRKPSPTSSTTEGAHPGLAVRRLPATGLLPGPGALVQTRRGHADQAGSTEPGPRIVGTKSLKRSYSLTASAHAGAGNAGWRGWQPGRPGPADLWHRAFPAPREVEGCRTKSEYGVENRRAKPAGASGPFLPGPDHPKPRVPRTRRRRPPVNNLPAVACHRVKRRASLHCQDGGPLEFRTISSRRVATFHSRIVLS